MRVKRAKKPARSIRYLLSADQKFQKISLRKMAERLKEAKQPPRSRRSKHPAETIHYTPVPWAVRSQAIVFGMICLVGAAAVIAARQPSRHVDVVSPDPRPAANAPVEYAAIAAPIETKKTVVESTPATAAATRTYVADASMGKAPAVKSAIAPAVESLTAPAVESAAVTVTGCLELDEETFWLKDTSGGNAPASRSWKSGFLKKRQSRIALVDAANTLRLRDQVGHRVAATGTLMDREMRARSLRRIAARCD